VEQTVPNHFLPSFVSFALRMGAAPEALFAGIGRSLPAARAVGALFSVAEVEQLYEQLCASTGTPDLALTLGREVDPERLGLYGLLLSTSSSPRASFAAFSEFKALFHPLLDLAALERDGHTYLRYQSRDGGPIGDKPFYAEGLFSAVHAASELYYGCGAAPLYVAFRHAAPHYVRTYERVFRCELRFGQPVDELCYGFSFLDTPWRGASSSHHALRAQAQREMARGEPPVVRQVRRVVHAQPARSIDDVAHELAMSTRSLQRSLGAVGTSYRALRDSVRHARACVLLREGEPTSAVASALGYRDRSNFVRAFERWAGESPSGYRARAKALAQNDTLLASSHTAE
jgi:AraC-like DNA-binding protein